MLNFVDINTGNIFNGSRPYQFWFDEGQSVGLNYVRNICVVCDSQYITATVDSEDSIFSMIDTAPIGNYTYLEIINQREYYNINDLKRRTIISEGFLLNQVYVHMLYILASSDNAGEFTDTFTLKTDTTEEQFVIGADFYNSDEVLQINLSNLGMKLPMSIQRAIYDKNPYEESPDSILLNRKMKELLLQYWDILANKGSYKSLINSLDWFEYGDLVHIESWWKHMETDTLALLEGHNIQNALADEMLQQLCCKVKTTYLGLYFTLNNIYTENGKTAYEDSESSEIYYGNLRSSTLVAIENSPAIPESANGRILQIGSNSAVNIDMNWIPSSVSPQWTGAQYQNLLSQYGFSSNNLILNELNPRVINLLTKWNHVDLSLKMTLLGNFFSTYFMPIHLDLIHSTIDKMIFITNEKVLYTSSLSRVDRIENNNPIEVEIITNHKIVPVTGYVYNNTLFGQKTLTSNPLDPSATAYCGIETELRLNNRDLDRGINTPQIDDIKTFIKYQFGGFGCLVKFKCKMHDAGSIIRETITWREGVDEEHSTTFMRHDDQVYQSVNDVVEIEFQVILQHINHYHILLQFESTSGHTFIKRIELNIQDDSRQQINLFKVNRISLDELWQTNLYNTLHMPDIAFQQRWANREYGEYTTFLVGNNSVNDNKIGLNHVLVLQLDEPDTLNNVILDYEGDETAPNPSFEIDINSYFANADFSPSNISDFINDLNTNHDHYWWDVLWRYVNEDDITNPPDPSKVHPILVGIRKAFSYADFICEGKLKFGLPSYKINVYFKEQLGNYQDQIRQRNLRIVDEDRFFPIFHKLEKLDSHYIEMGETIVCEPQFARSQMITGCTWCFKNVSNGDDYESKVFSYTDPANNPNDPLQGLFGDYSIQRYLKNQSGPITTFVGSYESDVYNWLRNSEDNTLKPGYYDIILNYSTDTTHQQLLFNSAFRINR